MRTSVRDWEGASRPVRRLLDALDSATSVTSSGDGWIAQCPAHDDDNPSLSIGEGDDGRALLCCHAGCHTEQVLTALNMEPADLFDRWTSGGSEKPRTAASTDPPPLDPSTATSSASAPAAGGCTLEAYAKVKALPLQFLKQLGLTEITYEGRPAVRIPYLNDAKAEIAVQFRVAVDGDVDGPRFKWRSGSKAQLYGLWRLRDARVSGEIVVCEGPSDCHTLWHHDLPALGLPSATGWPKDERAFEGFHTIYVVVEPDKGGEAVLRALERTTVQKQIRLVRLGEHKDVSAFYLANPATFKERWRECLVRATSLAHEAAARGEQEARRSWAVCEDLARHPDILNEFAKALRARGLAGEERSAKLVYLVCVSRLQQGPVCLAVKGPSSAGKSFLVEQTLNFFPASAYYSLTAMSPKALAYGEESLVHRMLIIAEAAGLGDDASYFIRTLLSEGAHQVRVRREDARGAQEPGDRARRPNRIHHHDDGGYAPC